MSLKAVDWTDFAFPKAGRGKTIKAVKARRHRTERSVVQDVRAHDVARDGYCRLFTDRDEVYQRVGACEGLSQMAHLGQKRRCHTRGMPPEARHTTQDTAMLCDRHHDAYDAHAFDLTPTTSDGADGPLGLIVPGFDATEV